MIFGSRSRSLATFSAFFRLADIEEDEGPHVQSGARRGRLLEPKSLPWFGFGEAYTDASISSAG